MDTLKVSDELHAAGLPETQAKAIARVVNDHGRNGVAMKVDLEPLATKTELWQHTVTIIASVAGLLGLFKIFS